MRNPHASIPTRQAGSVLRKAISCLRRNGLAATTLPFASTPVHLKHVLSDIDAEAIGTAMGQPHIPFAPKKTVEQQDIQVLHWARERMDLEEENARLRKAVSDLTLDKLILQEASTGDY